MVELAQTVALVALIAVLAALCVVLYRIATGELGDLTLRLEHRELPPPTSDEGEGLAALDVPDEVVAYCAKESEEWAREELMRRAQKLYRELGDWDQVMLRLRVDAEPGEIELDDVDLPSRGVEL